jgi:hypothetical protein
MLTTRLTKAKIFGFGVCLAKYNIAICSEAMGCI